jgi:excisionase family DNA binding protein
MGIVSGYLTTQELADALGVTPRRVLQLAKDRGVESEKVGQMRLWPKSALKALKPNPPGRPPAKDSEK